jgi:hypothetical protein
MKAANRLLRSAMQRFALATFNSPVSVSPVVSKPCSSLTSLNTLSLRACTGRAARIPSCHGVLNGMAPMQRLHSSRAAAAAEQQHSDSSSSSSAETHTEPGPNAAVSSEVADAPAASLEAAAKPGSSSVNVVDWSTFLEALWQRGYFEEHSSGQDK